MSISTWITAEEARRRSDHALDPFMAADDDRRNAPPPLRCIQQERQSPQEATAAEANLLSALADPLRAMNGQAACDAVSDEEMQRIVRGVEARFSQSRGEAW